MNINTIEVKKIILFLLIPAVAMVAKAAYNDTIAVKQLQEVTVDGARILHKDGHEVLLLDSRNRSFGTNALDAVSSLPRFITSLNDDKLTSWDHSTVFILINGVPSTAMDLRSYKGFDIKRVEYWSSAPSQYMALTDGPLVNIVMKKRHDRLYTGYFNASNSVTTGFGTNQIALTYSDSLNQVKAGYLLDYRDINDISLRSDYSLADEWTSSSERRKRYKGEYHSLYVSYQYYNAHHLLNAKLSFLTNPGKDDSAGEMTYTEGTGSHTSPLRSMLRSGSQTGALDLYYSYRFGGGGTLVANLVNTLGRSHSQSEISSPVYGTVESMTRSRSYSLIANTFFSSSGLGGYYTVGSRYEYKQLRQEYAALSDMPYSHGEFLSLGYSRTVNNIISLVPSVGLTIKNQSSGEASKTDVLPYFRMYADWWPGGKLKGFTAQLTLLSRKLAPQLSLLTNSFSYKDYHYLSVGNPDLKNYWENWGKLSLTYFVPGRRDQVTVMGQTRIYRDPIVSAIGVLDGNAYLHPANLKSLHRHRIDVFGSWYPFKWLKLSPYLEYYVYRYDASSPVRTSYLRYGGTVTVTVKGLELILAVNSPTKDFDGDLTVDGSAQYAAIAQYKIRNWSLGARFNYSGHNNRTYGIADGFSVSENSDWSPLHHKVNLTATYSFSVGRSRRHDSKKLNESSDDNGLNKFNKAAMPE